MESGKRTEAARSAKSEGKRGWWSDSVFYQIFPDRFARSVEVPKPEGLEPWESPPTVHGYKGGDLIGIVERLDWITDLGADAIYLNPIFQSASNHRYHTHDYFRVDPLLGGDEALDRLLHACHERGVRVVLDGVFNHASRGFYQFSDLLENGPKSPWADWFHVRDWPLHAFDTSRPPNYEAWWDMRALPKFNTDNPQVREYLMNVGEYWARRGIDGWRLDVPGEIKTPGFWEEFRERTKAVNPELYLVGEIWRDASAWISDGTRFDGAMNYLFAGYTISYVVGGRVDPAVVEGLNYRVYPPIDASTHGDAIERLLALYPEEAHLANLNLLASHDTVRLATLGKGDQSSAVLAALLLLTFPGAPCIYYGEEIGLEGAIDPDSRRSFPWDRPQAWDDEVLDAYRSLIALRRDHPALRSPQYRRLWPPSGEPAMLYLFERIDASERLLVGVNAGAEAETAALSSVDYPAENFRLLWGDGRVTIGEHTARIALGPRAGAIWMVD